MTQPASPPHLQTALRALMTRARGMEIVRIPLVGVITVLYWQHLLPLGVLLAAVVVGLYLLVQTEALDLVREHKIGTEIFVTVATSIAVMGGEYVAAVLMDIILIAVFHGAMERLAPILMTALAAGLALMPLPSAGASQARRCKHRWPSLLCVAC